MTMKFWHRVALSCSIALTCAFAACSTEAMAASEVFSNLPYAEAKQQAQKEEKLLLLDFTATWCPPCRKMESTTWVDESVQKYIKENAIAIQIDVDKDSKTSALLKIEAMPTLVLFAPKGGGKEFGRQVGYMSASELLRWMEGAKSGKTSKEIEKENLAGSDNSIWDRVSKARELATAGKNAESLDEYIWLWSNIRAEDPNLGSIRTGLVPMEIKKLSALVPSGKASVAALRDAAEQAGNRHDWILLNGILDDNARTLVWFDKAKVDPGQRDVILKNTASLQSVLYSNARYLDVANVLYADPIKKVNEIWQCAQDLKKPRPDTEVSKSFDPFPSMVVMLYGAYVGAGKDEEAQKIEAECIRLGDSPDLRTALANMANGMKTARAAHAKAPGNALAKVPSNAHAKAANSAQTKTANKAHAKKTK
ncbi:MAG: hypothetical protein C0507_16205 [Cyanobacteria bacterium PR.3.49]|nr:hypothetical protein [Cyanobacteria bacterium PR.3.49]